jgi:2-polyprenyl-3-methyl-5-hydroxy-6-metoxy-1,4-benzoquinol methylase
MPAISSALATDLHNYGIGNNFAASVLEPMLSSPAFATAASSATTIRDFLERLPPEKARHIRRTVNAVNRGRHELRHIADQIKPGTIFLDVGCGVGGMLVAAAQAGARVWGIEINEKQAAAARALLADHNLPESAVVAADVFSAEFDRVEHADIIASIMSIEHVADPRLFLHRLAGRLRPGGTLYLHIPNMDGVAMVARDPHYWLPIMTQLRHHTAHALNESQRGKGVPRNAKPYGVGDYFPLQWYLSVLTDAGLQPRARHRPDHTLALADSHVKIREIETVLADPGARFLDCDPLIIEEIRLRGAAYLERLKAAISNNSDDLTMIYLASTWMVLASLPE